MYFLKIEEISASFYSSIDEGIERNSRIIYIYNFHPPLILEKYGRPISKLNRFQTTVTQPSPEIFRWVELRAASLVTVVSIRGTSIFLRDTACTSAFLAREARGSSCIAGPPPTRPPFLKKRWRERERERIQKSALNTDISDDDLQPHNSTTHSTFPIPKWYAHALRSPWQRKQISTHVARKLEARPPPSLRPWFRFLWKERKKEKVWAKVWHKNLRGIYIHDRC